MKLGQFWTKPALLLFVLWVGVGCDQADSDEGTDTNADEGECDLSSFDGSTPELPPEFWDSIEIFADCTTPITLPEEAHPLLDIHWLGKDFHSYVRATLIPYVDEEELDCCDPGEFDSCIEANFEDGNGAEVTYVLFKTADPTSESTRTEEEINVKLSEGEAPWSELRLETRETIYDENDSSYDTFDYIASWTGTLKEGWPSDDTLTFSFYEDTPEVGWSRDTSWNHSQCTVNVFCDTGEWYQILTAESQVEILYNNNGLEGWIDGECIGIIDPDTWEIIGECEEYSL